MRLCQSGSGGIDVGVILDVLKERLEPPLLLLGWALAGSLDGGTRPKRPLIRGIATPDRRTIPWDRDDPSAMERGNTGDDDGVGDVR